MSKTVYALTPKGTRIGAMLDETDRVHLWITGGSQLGLVKLDRFPGGKLTAKTLTAFLKGA